MLKFEKFTFWGKLSILFIGLIVFIGLFAPYISPYMHNLPSGKALEAPNGEHLFGTDDLGIDLLSQIFYGARLSLLIGFSTAILAGLGGGILGVISGYYGGIIDKLIMRLADMMIALPNLPMMILLGAFLDPALKILSLYWFFFRGQALLESSALR